MDTPDYIQDYENFQKNYRIAETGGEEIGILISKMAGYYARYNIRLGNALHAYSTIKSEFQGSSDPATGKPMSTSKAEVLASSTPEAKEYENSRIHVQNLQEYINALKSLQKGALFEYQAQ